MLTEIWRGEALEGVYQLSCEGDTVYWLRRKGLGQPSQLYRLAPGARPPQRVATEAEYVRAMVFDRPHVYLTAIDRILRVPREPGGRVEVLARGEPQASDLVQDGEHLYWTNPWLEQGIRGRPPGTLDGTVRRMKKGGGPIETILVGETTLKLLGHDDADLYLATSHGLIALPLQGGPPRTLIHDEVQPIVSGILHGDHIYFTTGGELRSVPKRGGATALLARAQILIDVAILGQEIYLARNVAFDRGAVAQKAAVLRLGTGGGEAAEVPGLASTPLKLAAGTSALYVLDVPLLGRPGAPRLLVLKPGDDLLPPAPAAGKQAAMSDTDRVKVLDTIRGSSVLAIQSALEVLRLRSPDVARFQIRVGREDTSEVVILAGHGGDLGVRPASKAKLSARELAAIRSSPSRFAVLDTIDGSLFRAIQVARKAFFRRYKPDLTQYQIKVVRERSSVVIIFADKDWQAGTRGMSAGRPGFEVELNASDLRVLRSSFIR